MNDETPFLEKVFSKRGYKFLLFLVSYLLAITTVLLIFSIQDGYIQPLGYLAPGLYVFPAGFAYLLQSRFPDSEAHNFGFFIGWLTYLIITLCAVFTRNLRTSKILYFIFVFLLVLNIYGCVSFSN